MTVQLTNAVSAARMTDAPPPVVLGVGANIGVFTVAARKLGASVIAVEMIPAIAEDCLTVNARLNGYDPKVVGGASLGGGGGEEDPLWGCCGITVITRRGGGAFLPSDGGIAVSDQQGQRVGFSSSELNVGSGQIAAGTSLKDSEAALECGDDSDG